jgi:hypothetical protein
MITGLCDMVQFTSLSELINVLGVDGGGGACAAVASDDQVVVVVWQGGLVGAFDYEAGVGDHRAIGFARLSLAGR